jgi:hypothetical protein
MSARRCGGGRGVAAAARRWRCAAGSCWPAPRACPTWRRAPGHGRQVADPVCRPPPGGTERRAPARRAPHDHRRPSRAGDRQDAGGDPHQIQATERTAPVLPLMPGSPQRRSHDSTRHGTTNLYAALNLGLGPGHLPDDPAPPRGGVQAVPGPRRPGGAGRAWRARDLRQLLDPQDGGDPALAGGPPRFQVHFTPTYSSWLNLVERWFAESTTKWLRRGSYRSVPELTASIQPGSRPGTSSLGRLCGTRPPIRSLTASLDIYSQSLTRDTSQTAGPYRRVKRFQVGIACQPCVERLKLAGRRQQQLGRFATAPGPERDLPARRAVRARPNSFSGPASAAASSPSAASNAPAWYLACAAASARSARCDGSSVSATDRSKNAAAAASPPGAWARPAEFSSSAATCSSGPSVA